MGKLKASQKMIDGVYDMIKKLEDSNILYGDYEDTTNYVGIRYTLNANKFLFLYLTNYNDRVSIMHNHNNMPDTIYIRKEIGVDAASRVSYNKKKKEES